MGWDPTIKLLEGDFYRINVGYTQHQTVGILQVHGTDDLLGCGARIFRVKKVDDTEDKIYVLKDIWPEKNQIPEHQIYEDIITDVRQLHEVMLDSSEYGSLTQTSILRRGHLHILQHLVTPVDSVFAKVDDVEDYTETTMIRSRTLESSEDIPSRNTSRNSKTYTIHSDMEDDP